MARGSVVRTRASAALGAAAIGTAMVLAGSVLTAAPGARVHSAADPSPRAGPENPRIVFERTVYSPRIHVSNASGSWTEPLTGARAEFTLPRWHPSGRRILYAKAALNGRADDDLMLMSPRGHHKRVLLPGEGRNFVRDMAWAPRGRRIALSMLRGRTNDLWVYTLRTGEVRRLGVEQHPDRVVQDVDWSASGAIAFTAYDIDNPRDDSDLYVVQPDGSGIQQLTDTEDRSEWRPRFSPDGTKLVFVTDGARCRRLMVANADGTDQERARVGCAWGGSWSPDSRRLLVERFNDDTADIEIWDVSLDGSRNRFVAVGEDASWRPRPTQAVERSAPR